MKRIFTTYKYGIGYLLSDELVSFYAFFTMIFAGCSWLFANCNLSDALMLVVIMLGYVANTMLLSWFKGNTEGTRQEVACSICYTVIFVGLFIVGCIINVKIHIIMMAIILAVTAICIWIREYALPILFQSIALCAPIVIFIICFTQIDGIPLFLKIMLPIVYAFCTPFIAYYEDCAAAQNIFELAYDNTWSPEFDERMRKLDNSDKDIVV